MKLGDHLHLPIAMGPNRQDSIVNSFGLQIAVTMSLDYTAPIVQAVNAYDSNVAELEVWRGKAERPEFVSAVIDAYNKGDAGQATKNPDLLCAAGYIAGLEIELKRLKTISTAADELRAALAALLPEVDAEIEQRQTSGNDEYWQGLKALSDAGHAALAKAEGRANPFQEALAQGIALGKALEE